MTHNKAAHPSIVKPGSLNRNDALCAECGNAIERVLRKGQYVATAYGQKLPDEAYHWRHKPLVKPRAFSIGGRHPV